MSFNSPKTEPKKSIEKINTVRVDKIEIDSKPTQDPNNKPKNKIERSKIDINTTAKNKIKRSKIDINVPPRNKIEPRILDPNKEPRHRLQPRIIDPKAPPRHRIQPQQINPNIEPRHKLNPRVIDPKAPPPHKIEARQKKSKIEPKYGLQPQANDSKISNFNKDTLKLEKIKEEIKIIDWESFSDNWSITTRPNQYAEYKNVSLDPTKEVSKENPLYRHKEWLNEIYNNKNWILTDKDVAKLCNVHPSVIGKWRKKHHISRKLHGEGRWIDKRSGKVYVRVPQNYDHPELTKRPGRKSVYRLEHIYNIEKYLSQHPELELSKKYLIAGKYLKIGTRVKNINQDSKNNNIENLRINTNPTRPAERVENLTSENVESKNTLNIKEPIKSSHNNSKNKQVEKAIKGGTKPKQVSKKIQKNVYRTRITMPKDYNHPELTPNSDNRYIRLVHTAKMEKFLANNPELEPSKKYLIRNKYLRSGTEIHHINQIGNDNRIKNLWIYESKKEHAKGEITLYNGLKTLVGTNHIQFRNGKYFLNPDIDSFKLNSSELSLERKGNIPINYKDINLVKEEIKKIDWNAISNDWSIQVKKNQFVQKTMIVDPMRDCSTENPLHHHKEWVKHIVSDDRFNLTDSRLAKLCGITKDTARYWRDRMHGIKGKNKWGFERRVDDSDGRIWIRVPRDYANPVVQKEDHHRRFMLEHRYVIEQHLAKHPELETSKKCLIDGKYLKSEAHVHHINLNYQDNRTENLWVFETDRNHKEATKSLYSLVEELLNLGKIKFKKGKYHIGT